MEKIGDAANLFCKLAGLVRGVRDLIAEHRKVECKPKPDGMSQSQFGKGDVLVRNQSSFVRVHSSLGSFLPLHTNLILCKVPAQISQGEIRCSSLGNRSSHLPITAFRARFHRQRRTRPRRLEACRGRRRAWEAAAHGGVEGQTTRVGRRRHLESRWRP